MLQRILQIRKSLNLTQKDFSNKIGLKQSSYCDIEKGRCAITERTIIAICSKFNVNEDWLRNGSGEMFNFTDKRFKEFFDIYNNLSKPLQDFLFSTALELLKTQGKL